MDNRDRNILISAIGVILVGLDLFFLRSKPNLMYFILIILLVSLSLPFVLITTLQSNRNKKKEERFLEFARDLVDNVRAGTPISRSILNSRNKDYGPLSPHVKKLANQIEIGIPLASALNTFSSDIKSRVISRAISLISEAEKSGGEIEGILNSVANSVSQTEELKKEQKSAVYNLVVQGYIIFLVFIIIVLVLQYYIIPLTSGIGNVNDLNSQIRINPTQDLAQPLLFLLVVQSFFAGVVIGKISEGNFKDGIKHSFILVAITLLVSFGAKLLLDNGTAATEAFLPLLFFVKNKFIKRK